jgi:hypothetical protein
MKVMPKLKVPGVQFIAPMLSLCLFGCSSGEGQKRDWELIDKRSEWKSCALSIDLKSGKLADGTTTEYWRTKSGCLEFKLELGVFDSVDRWFVYSCTESKWGKLFGSSTERMVVTDPPGRPYIGASTKASPDEIVGITREKAGVAAVPLSLTDYPILYEWQVQVFEGPSVARTWLKRDDVRVVLAGSQLISSETSKSQKLNLCEKEMTAMLLRPADKFHVIFRVSPQNWTDPTRVTTEPLIYRTRVIITREVLERELANQLKGPADGSPTEAPSTPVGRPVTDVKTKPRAATP